jgi:hypothetical protein
MEVPNHNGSLMLEMKKSKKEYTFCFLVILG